MNSKRLLLGLCITAVFGLVVRELIALANFSIDPLTQSIAIGFIANGLGGFFARRAFALPALCLWALSFLANLYITYLIAGPIQVAFLSIVQFNFNGIALSALSVVVGAIFGQVIAQRSQRTGLAT